MRVARTDTVPTGHNSYGDCYLADTPTTSIGNIETLRIRLDEQELDKTDNAYGFEMGFPHDFLGSANKAVLDLEDGWFISGVSYMDFVPRPKPIPPHQGALDKQFKDLKAPEEH